MSDEKGAYSSGSSSSSSSSKENRDLLREDNLTYDDYASFDDGNRYELADGRLELMSPSPSALHQCISFEMQKRIARTCEDDFVIFYAPIDVILSKKEVRQPDLVMLHRSRMHLLSQRGIEGAPDVVAEILSPSTAKRDKLAKRISYARHGISEYWIVEPAGGVLELYSLRDGQYELTDVFAESDPVCSSVLTCVSFSMQEIMDSLPDVLK